MDMQRPKYLTEHEVAEMTGIKVATLRNHRSLGKGIPYVKLCRTVRYHEATVVKHLNDHVVEP